MLHTTDITIAHQRQSIALTLNNAMQHKMTGRNLRQYSITHFRIPGLSQNDTVAAMFQEGAHTISFDENGSSVPFSNHIAGQCEQYVIGNFLTLFGAKHTITALIRTTDRSQ